MIEYDAIKKAIRPISERGRGQVYLAKDYHSAEIVALKTPSQNFEGKTLQQWMLDNPKPDLEKVRSVMEQIVLGLRAMHRKDILHLDLKPSNIMIDAHGVVKLIDFGSSLAASTALMQQQHCLTHQRPTRAIIWDTFCLPPK